MEKKDNSNNAAQVINTFEPNNIPRCPECNSVYSLQLFYKEKLPNISYECENKHNGNILLENYLKKYNNFSILKEKCEEVKKTKKK